MPRAEPGTGNQAGSAAAASDRTPVIISRRPDL